MADEIRFERGDEAARSRAVADGAAAGATDALVAALSARLDALVASWELALRARAAAPRPDGRGVRSPAAVLAELEHELVGLERRCAELRSTIAAAKQAAAESERRAEEELRTTARENVARQYLALEQKHLADADAAAGDLAELEAVRDAYRAAVEAVRVTVRGAAG